MLTFLKKVSVENIRATVTIQKHHQRFKQWCCDHSKGATGDNISLPVCYPHRIFITFKHLFHALFSTNLSWCDLSIHCFLNKDFFLEL